MKSLNCVCVFFNVRIKIIVKNNNPIWSQGIETIVTQHDNNKLKQVDMVMWESEITKNKIKLDQAYKIIMHTHDGAFLPFLIVTSIGITGIPTTVII